MIKTILVDDERGSIQSLQFELTAYCPDIEVVATSKDPREAIDLIKSHKPELVFLDIEMPGMNGFELLQQFTSIDFNVIFVTAYDQFAIQAFEFNAIDYILKPVRKEKLVNAVQKIVDRQSHEFPQDQLMALVNNIQLQSQSGIEKIALPTSDGYEFVHVNNIVNLRAESNYTWVHLVAKKYLVAKTLKEMSSMIPFPQFFRAHKSHLVNLNHVTKYVRGSGGYLVLDNGEQIPVSRSQKESLMSILNV